MNCDKYCKGRSTEIDCSSHSGNSKDECIKSCLDCRSPNKKYCYCPSIFPPKSDNGGRQGEGNKDKNQFVAEQSQGAEEDTSDDTVFWSCLIAAIIIIAICFLIFCWMRYKKRKQSVQGTSTMEGRRSANQPNQYNDNAGYGGPM